jgi:hypothetical protein
MPKAIVVLNFVCCQNMQKKVGMALKRVGMALKRVGMALRRPSTLLVVGFFGWAISIGLVTLPWTRDFILGILGWGFKRFMVAPALQPIVTFGFQVGVISYLCVDNRV